MCIITYAAGDNDGVVSRRSREFRRMTMQFIGISVSGVDSGHQLGDGIKQ